MKIVSILPVIIKAKKLIFNLRPVSHTSFHNCILTILIIPTVFLSFQVESISNPNGGTLIFGRGGDSIGLDPAHEVDGESFKVCDNIYDTLVQYKPGTTEIEPALAVKWETSADGLIWTFHLRSGVMFHDGTPFNSESVLFSLNRQHNNTHPFHNVSGNYTYLRIMIDWCNYQQNCEFFARLQSPPITFA